MATNNFFQSTLPLLYNVTQNNAILYPKELIVATLRDYFSNDTYYRSVLDPYGYPLTPEQLNLPQTAGFPPDSTTTRLLITENYRFDVQYFPSIHVANGGSRSVPLSINRGTYETIWDKLVFEDGYGNITTFPNPIAHIFYGSWEGTINVNIKTKDIRARDDLVDLVLILFTDIAFTDLYRSGVIVLNASASAPAEQQDRNDYIFTQTVSLNIKSEWRRRIPISSLVEIIDFIIQFGQLSPEPGPIDPNLTINTYITLQEALAAL